MRINSMTAHTGSGAGVRDRATFRSRLKKAAVIALLSGVAFTGTGCYDDPYYYGQRRVVRAGYYAPAPYHYGYDPYYSPYGYGYGTGVGIGVSSYRSYSRYRPRYYGRGDYRRGGYYRRDGGRRDWDRRGSRDRRWDRRAQAQSGSREVRRSTSAPRRGTDERVERQPE